MDSTGRPIADLAETEAEQKLIEIFQDLFAMPGRVPVVNVSTRGAGKAMAKGLAAAGVRAP
jgi:tRNA(Met) C34 N-acetyltransferase TmcA